MNESLGWIWIHLGVISGALLGLGFLKPDFLGGYGSPRRRLLRLGHISFFGLGLLNLLFAASPLAIAASGHDGGPTVPSVGLVIAAISMPIACAAVAWSPRLSGLFIVPVGAALLATGSIAWEVLT